MKPKPPLESEIQHAIIQYLELRKFIVVKVNNTGVYVKARDTYIPPRQKGIPDLLCMAPGGRYLAVEVKRPGQHPSDDQRAFLERVEAKGGLALVAYSLDDVIKFLKEQGV